MSVCSPAAPPAGPSPPAPAASTTAVSCESARCFITSTRPPKWRPSRARYLRSTVPALGPAASRVVETRQPAGSGSPASSQARPGQARRPLSACTCLDPAAARRCVSAAARSVSSLGVRKVPWPGRWPARCHQPCRPAGPRHPGPTLLLHPRLQLRHVLRLHLLPGAAGGQQVRLCRGPAGEGLQPGGCSGPGSAGLSPPSCPHTWRPAGPPAPPGRPPAPGRATSRQAGRALRPR